MASAVARTIEWDRTRDQSDQLRRREERAVGIGKYDRRIAGGRTRRDEARAEASIGLRVARGRGAPSRLLKKQMTTAFLFSTPRGEGPASDLSDAQPSSSVADDQPPRARVVVPETVARRSYGLGREVPDADQVVRGKGKRNI